MWIWKKRICIFAISILLFSTGLIVDGISAYAGSINEAESELIAAASGTFTYQGETYRATSSALSQLSGYLSADGIDLTSSQSQKAISYMYAHIGEGVRRGYVEKVSGSDENPSESVPQEVTETPTETTERVGTEASKQTGQQAESEGSSTIQETEEDMPISSFEDWEEFLNGGELNEEGSDTETVLYNSVGIIKDTGYYLTNAWLVFFMFLLLIGMGGIIIVRGYKDKKYD